MLRGGRAHCRLRQRHAGDDFSRCVSFCGRHAQDARHLGRYEPEGQYVARRLFRQWHGWFAGYVAPCVVFP